MLLPSVLLSDLIALMPDNWTDLMNHELMDMVSEMGLNAAKERYRWTDFSDYYLVDPYIDPPIEFINRFNQLSSKSNIILDKVVSPWIRVKYSG